MKMDQAPSTRKLQKYGRSGGIVPLELTRPRYVDLQAHIVWLRQKYIDAMYPLTKAEAARQKARGQSLPSPSATRSGLTAPQRPRHR